MTDRSVGSRRRWRSRLGGSPTLTRKEIERDAAAQVGVSGDPLEQPPAKPVFEHDAEPREGTVQPAPTTPEPGPRPAGVRGWLRELVSPEPADVRRRRLEAEAAAELGLDRPHDQAVGF